LRQLLSLAAWGFIKMKTYSEKLKDPRWQKKRLCVMQRDGFKCRDCGGEKKTLNVHHCMYQRGEPWETEDAFLLTLCEGCHEQRGDIEQAVKTELSRMMAETPPQALRRMVEFHGASMFGDWRQEACNWMHHEGDGALVNEWIIRMINAEASVA
jgi:hypothetical protein